LYTNFSFELIQFVHYSKKI